jgi:hypothetical protein
MPISFSSGNGGGGSYLRVNMPQNRWTYVSDAGQEDLPNPVIAFDVAKIQLGWLAIDTGFRDWQAWPGNTETVAPGDNYKRGFELDCWVSGGRAAVCGAHGTFSGNSYGQTSFIERLYNEAEKAPEFAAGKVPVVKITASTPISIGKGTSYNLEFVIGKWIDRPDVPETPPEAPVSQPVGNTAASGEAGPDEFGF